MIYDKRLLYHLLQAKYPLLNPIYRYIRYFKDGSTGIVFMMHRVGEIDSAKLAVNEGLKISSEKLEQVICRYKAAGFVFLSLSDLFLVLSGRKKVNKPFVCFTLDDGYKDNYINAYPIFLKYNIPFTVYVSTDFPDNKAILWWYILEDLILSNKEIVLGDGSIWKCITLEDKNQTFLGIRKKVLKISQQNFAKNLMEMFIHYPIELYQKTEELAMSWDEIKIMSESPLCTIGGHSITHPPFNVLAEEELNDEIVGGINLLRTHINKEIKHFAFPFGTSNEIGSRELEFIQRYSFETVVMAEGGCINKKTTQCHCIPRFYLGE